MTVREKILEHATEQFLQTGIRANTMDDISRMAGVSKRTIYEHFKDKDDLVRATLVHIDKKFSTQRDVILAESENTIEMVFGMMKLSIQALNKISPLFFDDLKRRYLKIWKEVHRVNLDNQMIHILTILKKGINQGLFRKEINVEIVSALLMQQLRIMPDKNIFPEEKFSKQLVFENVIINFFRGIATPKGHELIDKFLEENRRFFISV